MIPNRLYCVASLLLLLLLLQAYKDSKLCNMLFMAEAARRTPRLVRVRARARVVRVRGRGIHGGGRPPYATQGSNQARTSRPRIGSLLLTRDTCEPRLRLAPTLTLTLAGYEKTVTVNAFSPGLIADPNGFFRNQNKVRLPPPAAPQTPAHAATVRRFLSSTPAICRHLLTCPAIPCHPPPSTYGASIQNRFCLRHAFNFFYANIQQHRYSAAVRGLSRWKHKNDFTPWY